MKTWAKLLTAAVMTIAGPAAAQSAAGDWAGTLVVSDSVRLPLVVHIRQDDAGVLSGTLDSPAQGAAGIPLAGIAVTEGKLTFEVPAISGAYEGMWDETSSSWKGMWSQGGSKLPLALGAPPPPRPLPANWSVPSDAEIETLIAARIAPRVGQGVVIGVLEPGDRRIAAGGPQGGEAFDGSTLFELGSISKVFTALILADMANKGEVSLSDPAEKYLPAGHRMPERNGRKITLRDLATHVSGLPRLPDNMPFADTQDPYADYTEAMMLAFLDGYELTRDVGERWEYSNLGAGLLGYLLGRAAGSDYETLLRERITTPLGMSDTAVTLPDDLAARLATPHDEYLRPTKPWALPSLAGAGGIRSTAEDMLKFAAAVLDPASPIGDAMKTALSVREDMGNERAEQALGWQVVHPEPGREVIQHGGGTGGFRTHLVLEPSTGRAVIALANSAAEPSATDLAMHALIGSSVAETPPVPPAPPPASVHTEVTLPAAELDRVTGSYDFGNGVVFEITREGDGLRAQRKGSAIGPVLPIFPEAPLRFFYKAIDAQFRFTADDSGKVTGAEFVQGALTLPGTRTEP